MKKLLVQFLPGNSFVVVFQSHIGKAFSDDIDLEGQYHADGGMIGSACRPEAYGREIYVRGDSKDYDWDIIHYNPYYKKHYVRMIKKYNKEYA